jgi:hypothetical protein
MFQINDKVRIVKEFSWGNKNGKHQLLGLEGLIVDLDEDEDLFFVDIESIGEVILFDEYFERIK